MDLTLFNHVGQCLPGRRRIICWMSLEIDNFPPGTCSVGSLLSIALRKHRS